MSNMIHHRLSDVLLSLARDETREAVSIGDLREALGNRSTGALLLVLALPNAIPAPPGLSAITGLPLMLISACLMCGKEAWLPAMITRRSVSRQVFSRVAELMVPWLERAERMLRPRLDMLSTPAATRVAGLLCLVLSIVIALPAPLGNIPPAVTICCFALAILERDGLFFIAGVALTIASLTLVSGVLYVIFRAILFFLSGSWA